MLYVQVAYGRFWPWLSLCQRGTARSRSATNAIRILSSRGNAAHFLPGDDPAPTPYSWRLYNDATGHFEVGTSGSGAQHVLAETLPYLRKIGMEKIQAHRQPLLKKLREEMPRLGFAS